MTLSHCWGTHQPVTTTTSNLEERLLSIGLDDLPLTFRHAILLTQRLNIKYIWIDSLCILQDDSEDWLREAPNMGNIYANSYCTISATFAKDATHGLFSQTKNGLSVLLHDRTEKIKFWATDPHDFSTDVDAGNLNTRAWVLQERVLSPRNIHFTEERIYWECSTHIESEDGFPVASHKSTKKDFSLEPNDEYGILHSKERWYHLVAAYTRCRITRPTDRLVAVSGLVDRLTKHLTGRYFAGVWSDSFGQGLLWAANEGTLTHSETYIAPSWSWASTEGPKQYLVPGDGFESLPDMELLYLEERTSARYRVSSDRPNIPCHTATVLARLRPMTPLGSLVRITTIETLDVISDVDTYYECGFGVSYQPILDVNGYAIGWVVLDSAIVGVEEIEGLWLACVNIVNQQAGTSTVGSDENLELSKETDIENPAEESAKRGQPDSGLFPVTDQWPKSSPDADDDELLDEDDTINDETTDYGLYSACVFLVLRRASQEYNGFTRVGVGKVVKRDWFKYIPKIEIVLY